MTEKDPIEIGRSRRPMECELTEAERKIRSDQVHSHLEIRSQKEAERDKLEAQAKATKELGKAKDEEITELDLKIKELSTAVRTGRATIEVEIVSLYDPAKGEIVEKRADTGLLMPLNRKPTIQEWDEIKRAQQVTSAEVKDGKYAGPVRSPYLVPGIDVLTIYGSDAETWLTLGRAINSEDGEGVTDEYVAKTLRALHAADQQKELPLTPGERAELVEGLKQGLRIAQHEPADEEPDADAPPVPEELLERARELARADRQSGPAADTVLAGELATRLGRPEISLGWRNDLLAAYQKEATAGGSEDPAPAEAVDLGAPQPVKRGRGRPRKEAQG